MMLSVVTLLRRTCPAEWTGEHFYSPLSCNPIFLTPGYSNLMAKDDFKNLGFNNEPEAEKKKEDQESHKGELRW